MGEMRVDPLELALAPDLVDLVDTSGGDLLDRVRALRRKVALELGILMPPVRTRDDLALELSTYSIRISGVEVATGQAPPGTVLAIGEGLDFLPGRAGVEPVFGLPGRAATRLTGFGRPHGVEGSGRAPEDRAVRKRGRAEPRRAVSDRPGRRPDRPEGSEPRPSAGHRDDAHRPGC